jgi:hypothetical protein
MVAEVAAVILEVVVVQRHLVAERQAVAAHLIFPIPFSLSSQVQTVQEQLRPQPP